MTYAHMDCKEIIRLNSRARKNGTIYTWANRIRIIC